MSKHPDAFGDRMKDYEGREAKERFLPMLPIIARIDGRTFSKFTKPFKRPFDERLSNAMRLTTAELVSQTHAVVGYTQSDEITLVFHADQYDSQIFFGGRKQKLCSVLASMTTALFIRYLDIEIQEYPEDDDIPAIMLCATPHFDCRVWQVPSTMEATNTLLWRAQDAKKNGISSACRSMCSAKSMHGKGQADMVQMMADQGVDYYSTFDEKDRLGTFWKRETFVEKLDDETLERIPVAKRPVDGMVTRSRVVQMPIGYLGDVENREDVIFHGHIPMI